METLTLTIVTPRKDGCNIEIDEREVRLVSNLCGDVVDRADITGMSALDLATWIKDREDW